MMLIQLAFSVNFNGAALLIQCIIYYIDFSFVHY
jgi:hypothetical protein